MARINPRAIVVTFAILWLFFYPSSHTTYAPSEDERQRATQALDASLEKLAIINSSSFGDFAPWEIQDEDPDSEEFESKWLNLTGFRKDDGYAWSQIPVIHERVRVQIERALGKPASTYLDGASGNVSGIYKNMTGSLKGDWVRLPLDLQPPVINVSHVAPESRFVLGSWDRNVTTDEGAVQMRIDQTNEEITEGVVGMTASVAVQSNSAFGGGWEVQLYGAHWPSYGHAILTTTSDKFAGIYGLPHLGLSANQFDLAKINLNTSLTKMLDRRREMLPDAARLYDPDVGPPKCELLVYLQQLPTESGKPLDFLEYDLRFPSGDRPTTIPPLSASITLFSPDCGYALVSKGPPDFPPSVPHLTGHKTEETQQIVRNLLLGTTVLLTAQLYLLTRQMRISSTPSRQSKISIRTLNILFLGDYMILMVAAFLVPVADGLLIPLVLTLFLSLIGGSLLPSRIMLDVFNAQEPERLEAERERQRAMPPQSPPPQSSPTSPLSSPTYRGTSAQEATPLPPPVLAGLAATPFTETTFTPTTREPTRQTFPRLYTLNVLSLIALFFLTALALATLSPFPLYLYTRALALLYASPWLPQIWRQATRSYTSAFSPWFISLISILKFLPLAWLWGERASLLGYTFALAGIDVGEGLLPMKGDERFILVVAAWLWIQFIVLSTAEVLGGRWWVPRFMKDRLGMKELWDWSDISVIDVEERGESECAICMCAVPLPLDKDSSPPLRAEDRHNAERAAEGQSTDTVRSSWQTLFKNVKEMIDSVGAIKLGRSEYMVTPCRHVFHRECLVGWMGLRLQCPVCRESLPAL